MRTMRGLVAVALAVGVVLAPSVLDAVPSAAGPPGSAAHIQLRPAVGPPTTTFTVRGQRFGPSEVVDIDFDTDLVGNATTDSNGRFSAHVAVPTLATPADHTVTATGESSGLSATATFTVRTNWPRFHFDPVQHRLQPIRKCAEPFKCFDPRAEVGGSDVLWNLATPVVSGGVVFVAPADGIVRALDAVTGATIWSADIGSEAIGMVPDVAGGTVYVGSANGSLYAIAENTGQILWTAHLGSEVLSVPVVKGSLVFIAVERQLTPYLMGLDASTGSPLWSDFTGDSVYPAVADNAIFQVSALPGMVEARNTRTGKRVWDYSACGEICLDSSATAADGLVFTAFDIGTLALVGPKGTLAWSRTPAGTPTSTAPAVANGTVYWSSNAYLTARDERTGVVLWQASLPAKSRSSPAVANGVVYVGADDGVLRAFDAITGDLLWSSPTAAAPFAGSPAVSDGVLYDASDDGTVYAFGLPP